MEATDFRSMDRARLMDALLAGHPIDPSALDDWQYRGVSLGMPAWVDRIAWKTFVKAFHRDPATGDLRGWNVRLEQTGIDGPVEPQVKKGEPVTFGHFRVVSPEGYRMPRPATSGLLLDYGSGGNPRLDPTGRIRDPIVAVNEGSADLLLGWTYVDLGSVQVGTPSFFTLERYARVESPATPPRA